MSLSPWYADIVLPGSNATAVYPNYGDLSTDFPLSNPSATTSLTYRSNFNIKENVFNPQVGSSNGFIFNGDLVFEKSEQIPEEYVAIDGVQISSSSSESFSSSSSSSLSSFSSSSSCSTVYSSSSSQSMSFSSSSSCSSSSYSSSCSSSSSSLSSPFYWQVRVKLLPDLSFGGSINYEIIDTNIYSGIAGLSWQCAATYLSSDLGAYTGCSSVSSYDYGVCVLIKAYDGEIIPPLPLSSDLSSVILEFTSVYNQDFSTWSLLFSGISNSGSISPWYYFDCCSTGGSFGGTIVCLFKANVEANSSEPLVPDSSVLSTCACISTYMINEDGSTLMTEDNIPMSIDV